MKKLFLCIFLCAIWVPRFGFSERDSPGGFVSAEALFWIANESGLGFTNEPANVLSTDNFTSNPVFDPSFEWEWGFRLGGGYIQDQRHWGYEVFWTNLKAKAHGQKSFNSGAPDFEGSFPIWSIGPDTLVGDYVSSSSSSWHLTMNLVDLNAQYRFCLGKCGRSPCEAVSPLKRKQLFANRKKKGCIEEAKPPDYEPWFDRVDLIPFIGIRMVILDQSLSARYEGGTFFSGVDLNSLECDYWGGGPRLGLIANYFMAYGTSLFGRAALAPLYGRFDLKDRETYLDAVRFDRSNVLHHWLLSVDFAAGVSWKGAVIDDWMFVILGAAYEGQAFIRGNRFFRGPFFFHKIRNLLLQGLTMSAALEF